MKYLVYIVFLTILLICSCTSRLSFVKYEHPYVVKDADIQLLKAYYEHDKNYLDGFFKRWDESSTPITDDELIHFNDTLKTIYKFFSDFYRLDTTYLKYEYIVLQNEIHYSIVSDKIYMQYGEISVFDTAFIQENIVYKKILDFRPRISNEEVNILYLTKDYYNTLNFFFNEENGNYSCIKHFNEKINKRKESYLSEKIKISKQHWCEGHHYCSFPIIESLVINHNLSEVKILYRYSWFARSGYEYKFSHDKSQWIKFKSLQLGGVE